MSLQEQYQTIEYPQKKDVWGPAYWVYLHTSATQYPKVPDRSDRLNMNEHIKQWLNFIPCEDPCQIHAKQFVKQNPPALDSRNSLLEWTCALHNAVNERLGKPIMRCVLANEEVECSDCKVAAAGDIAGSMKMYKSATIEIIKELSKRHELKQPEIRFAACPLHPDTSCIEWKKEDLNDKGVLNGPAIIYINPYAASFKTPIHEFQHYLDLMKGRGHHLSEYEANRFAFDILAKMFPHDTAAARGGNASAAASESERIDPFKMPLGYEYSNFKNWEERFPAFKAVRDRARKQEQPTEQSSPQSPTQPQPQPQPDSQEEKTGIMSHIDSMYQLPAEWSGLRAHDLNMAWTPEIITNAVTLLIRSNLSGLGSALFGFVTSLSLMLTGIFAKQGLAYGDRQLLQNLSASFLMSTLNYANPKFSSDVIMDGKYMIGSVMSGQFGGLKNALWETPEIYTMKQHKLHAEMGGGPGGPEVEGIPFSFGPGFAGAGESVRAQQQASQRNYDASRPGGAVSLSQGPFGRGQRVIGRNPRRLVMNPPNQVQPPGQAMFVSGDYQNFSGFGGSSPGPRPMRRSPAADDTDIDVTMSPDTYGNDSLDY